jgi:lysophospholipase L1-like esterase
MRGGITEKPLRGSKTAGLTLRALLAVVLLLAVTECVLRLGFGFGHPLLYVPDARAGYIAAPNQDLHRLGAWIHINEYGMRSGDVRQPKPFMARRLLFVGDSVTFGTTYVDQERIFTTLIQDALDRRHGEVTEVLNASAGGWAPENEYGYLTSRGTFDADFVIFVVNTNDLGQPFEQFKASPQFPVKDPLTATGEVLERYVAPRIISGIQTSDPGSLPTSEPDPAVEIRVLQALSQATAFARSHGAVFMLVFSPTDAAELQTPAWKKAIENLKIWAHDSKVTLIDMSARYSRYEREQVYFDGLHLRPFGHQLIAAEFLSEFDAPSSAQH